MHPAPSLLLTTAALGLVIAAPAAAGGGLFATKVVSYDPGTDPAPGYTTPAAALGSPERMTGEGVFPGVVSIYNGPWLESEIVSIGTGGSLVLGFAQPVEDDPANPWGIDVLVFGNAFFVAGEGGINGLFADGGSVEVSADGVTWVAVEGAADGLFPTQGYRDVQPYDAEPGVVPTTFGFPVHPLLGMDDFIGADYDAALAWYDRSGGGLPIDLAATGLDAISFVRIANTQVGFNTEVDAVVDVDPIAAGDTNGDGVTDLQDLVAVIIGWGPIAPGTTTADLDGNGVVDVADLTAVITNWS
ncbi:MAG: hypothetical protein ACYTF9_05830 [Planctomycetota bacterium]